MILSAQTAKAQKPHLKISKHFNKHELPGSRKNSTKTSCAPSPRQADLGELEDSLFYIMSSRLAGAAEQNPVSKLRWEMSALCCKIQSKL